MLNNNADSITVTNGDAAASQTLEQAYWTIPGTPARVVYSLPLMQEIDFAVNEGYRKIPHGGIEIGALLFGSIDENGTTIEAFRVIECEHVFGPSFMLSERDLRALSVQIENAAVDPTLQNLQLAGWFLAHTRGPLQMTDPELELFDRFFPQPGQLTLLVKPERFQPTLFGFLVRAADGKAGRDASQDAIILPLASRPGAKGTSAGPQPSLAAPRGGGRVRPPRTPERPMPLPESRQENAAAASGVSLDGHMLSSPAEGASSEESATSDIRAARRRLRFEEARLLAEGTGEELGAAAENEPAIAGPPFTNAVVPIKKKRAIGPELPEVPFLPEFYPDAADLAARPVPASSRLLLVLPLAALIGSAVGYVAYRQIPSPVIPLNARGSAQSVLVSWPPTETRSADYAAIRVDDSAPVPLSPGEKSTGQLELSATPDMKIELITHNWLRNSRGIVRFVRPDVSTAPAANSQQ